MAVHDLEMLVRARSEKSRKSTYPSSGIVGLEGNHHESIGWQEDNVTSRWVVEDSLVDFNVRAVQWQIGLLL